jgi:SSS family transporter
MTPSIILVCIALYFVGLLSISWFTSKESNNDAYFTGNHQSPWYVVAFGMIGDSLSGVTFISLPGTILTGQFGYLQMVFGYVLGYFVIAKLLLPLYYKLNLTSIYSYLNERFGSNSQKTGSFYFLISRIIGAALRLFLAASVLQIFVFDNWGIPFEISVALIILLMLLYTYRGGIKTLVWTDLFQSGFLLLAVILSIYTIYQQLDWGFFDGVKQIANSNYSTVFFTDWHEKNYFFKQFISGAFITIVMTGLDQNMMQKNLSCKSLPEAQKNMYSFGAIVLLVNVFFLSLGALIYLYVQAKGVALPMNELTHQVQTDKVFPMLALNHLGLFAALVFIVGLTAATFNSADSVLTTLTTSFCIDFLGFDTNPNISEKKKTYLRHIVHVVFAIILWVAIVLSKQLNQSSVLDAIFTIAAYTYGPLLGLFAFGLFSKQFVNDKLVPLVSVFPPIICYVMYMNSADWFSGYKFGYELLLLNGLLMYAFLYVISKKNRPTH